MRTFISISVLICTTLLPAEAGAGQAIPFTREQVDRGNATYIQYCQICHGTTLANGQFGAPLRGSFFRNNWSGKSLGELVKYTYESMPPDNVMSLAPEQYAEVVAFILDANKVPASDMPISGDFKAMGGIMLPW